VRAACNSANSSSSSSTALRYGSTRSSRARVRWLDNLFTYDTQRARAYALARSSCTRCRSLSLSFSLSLCLSTPLEAEKATRFTRKVTQRDARESFAAAFPNREISRETSLVSDIKNHEAVKGGRGRKQDSDPVGVGVTARNRFRDCSDWQIENCPQ